MWAYRHLNSKYEIKNVPPFSTEDSAFNPPRWPFVFRRTLLAAVYYLLADLLSARPPPKNNAALFDDALVPVFRRLGSITSSQLQLRALSTAGFWLTVYCVVQGGHAVASAMAVTLGLSDVGQWRPIFGSVSVSYTLRDFWGYDFLLFWLKERFAPTIQLMKSCLGTFGTKFSEKYLQSHHLSSRTVSSSSPKDQSQRAT